MSPIRGAGSERGVALIIVLLLLAVMSGLATGLTVNGQVEIAMATNEIYYAGARAAAEAGANRARAAIVADTTTNLLAGQDGAVDASNPAAAVNADNGRIDFRLTGGPTYALGTTGQYTYTIQILDDDDPSLYTTALTPAQLAAMGNENGSGFTDTNDRLILQVTGFGPSGTTVRIRRILSSIETSIPPPPVPPPAPVNAAIVVAGNLQISGNPNINGNNGSVQANGNLTINGYPTITQNAFASGTFTSNPGWTSGGSFGGGQPTVTVPAVNAADYQYLATHRLTAGGEVILVSTGLPVAGTGWVFSAGVWVLSGNDAASGTYYVEGNATVSGNPNGPAPGNSDPLALSIIATGSIEVSGNPTFTPQNNALYQFITDGDLKLGGNVDIAPTTVEGQSLVRNQLMISGNPDVRGRIIVENLPTVAPATDHVVSSVISGNPNVTYNGSFPGLSPPPPPTAPPTTTYKNQVIGWIES
jgi:Tfp pilus assembly protein PilX